MSVASSQLSHEASQLHAGLREIVDEVACVPNLVAVRLEVDTGVSQQAGVTLESLFEGVDDAEFRRVLSGLASAHQEVVSISWSELYLSLHRVGARGCLWVCCKGPEPQRQVMDIWKKRRKAWALRLDEQRMKVVPQGSSDEQGWRANIPARVLELLERTRDLFVELRGAQQDIEVDQAREEFELLAKEWATYCDPSVVSVPMLLDSLRQSLSAEGELRTQFFERMQVIMASSIG